MFYLLVLFFTLSSTLATNITDVCLEDEDCHEEFCFKLIADEEFVIGKVCVSTVTTAHEPCSSCSWCPCTAFKIRVFIFPKLTWYLDLVRLWIGLNISNVPTDNEGIPITGGFPFKCIPKHNCDKCCDNQCCEIFVPFKYVYGNF